MAQLLAILLLAISYPLSLFWAIRRNSLWRIVMLLDSLLIFFLGYSQLYIVLACVLLAALHYAVEQVTAYPRLHSIVKFAIALLALLLGFHFFPGFEKMIFLHAYTFSKHSAAFDVAYPLDKALGAVLLLGYGVAFSVSRLPEIKSIFVISVQIVCLAQIILFSYPYLSPTK